MILMICIPVYNITLDTRPYCNCVAQLQFDTDKTYFDSCSKPQCWSVVIKIKNLR